jgi:hypothetical protein
MNIFNCPLEDGKSEKSLVDGLGTIQVIVHRVTVNGESQDQTFRKTNKSESKCINEKAKKALITHSVK